MNRPRRRIKVFRTDVAGAGQPMLLLPGLGCTGAVWQDTVAHFKDRYECHSFTFAGFGGLPPIGGRLLPQYRDAVIAYIRAKSLKRPVLVGHSLGGFLAYAIAAAAPGEVGAVVAIDAALWSPAILAPGHKMDEMRKRAAEMRKSLRDLKPEQFYKELGKLLPPDNRILDPAKSVAVGKMTAVADIPSIVDILYELLTTDLRGEARRIKAPVLVLIAGAALQSPDEAQAKIAQWEAHLKPVADVRVVLAAKANHFVPLDDPEFAHRTIEEFLAAKNRWPTR